MSWIDEGLKLQIQGSTSGDFVKLGKATIYPFEAGGGYIPNDWSYYFFGGAIANDISWTTRDGRFSMGNVGSDVHSNKRYGIYRTFTVPANKRWLVQVQCRTTQNRTSCIRYIAWAMPQSSQFTYLTQVWTEDNWEQVSLYTSQQSATTLRVWLIAAPYDQPKEVSGHDPVDANWGIQFQNLTLIEQEPTYPAPTWKDITCDVHSLNIHHGRDKFLNRYDVSTAQLEIINDKGDFTYGISDWLRPGRFLNIKGIRPPEDYSGSPYSMFYGVIDSIGQGFTLDGRATVTLSCLDISSLLSNINVPTYSDQFETFWSGTRFHNLVLAAGWHPQFISVDAGKFLQQGILSNGRSVRDELGLIADSEGGYFYADRDGQLIYRDRTWPDTDSYVNTVQAELLATPYKTNLPATDPIPTSGAARNIPLQSISTEWSRDRVVNLVSMANQGGTAIVTNDFDSQQRYGPRTYQRHDLLNVNERQEYLAIRTQDVMDGYTDAILRVNNVTFTPSRDNYAFALYAFLNWLVRIRYEHPTEGWGFGVVSHIQGITHTLTTNSWQVTLTVDQPESFNYYELSEVGWDAAIWDLDVWDATERQTRYLNPAVGTVSTPDTPDMAVTGPVRLSMNFQIDSVGTGFPTFVNKAGATREIMIYAYGVSDSLYFSTNGASGYADILIARPVPLGNHTVGAEFQPGSVSGVAIVDDVRTPVNFNQAPLVTDTPAGVIIGHAQLFGRIYWVQLEKLDASGNPAGIVWRFDASEYPGTGTTFTDLRGRVWTLTNAAAIVPET